MIDKNTIKEKVEETFGPVFDRGYELNVLKDLDEVCIRPNGRKRRGYLGQDLPEKYWPEIYNISFLHKDSPNRQDEGYKSFCPNLFFLVTDCEVRKELGLGYISLDEARRKKDNGNGHKSDGRLMIECLASFGRSIDFDKIKLYGPYMPNPYCSGEPRERPNFIDWMMRKYPRVGNLKPLVGKEQIFVRVDDILNQNEAYH